mmetsp:Transcript_108315/g.151237  ORF Transcript_108315/g.151237 Transcript_108315/m.151237 type:complete len:226 (+) Transcript_108315:601-1278(+)
MPKRHVVMVLSMGLLHSRRYHCERSCGGACEGPQLCCFCLHHGKLDLPGHRGMDLGWRLDFHPFRCRLHGLCWQRHCPPDWRCECPGWNHRPRSSHGTLRQPGGVRASQFALGGVGHFRTLVRLVWLQPWQHPGHARWRYWCHGGASSNEHYFVSRQWWHHSVYLEVCNHEEIRCGWPLQRYPCRLGVHHGWLWQHGVWKCFCHRLDRWHRLSRIFHAVAKVEDR